MKCLLSEAEIAAGVAGMAREIDAYYRDRLAGRTITIVGITVGCFIFLADLVRRLDLPIEVELVRAKSYRGASQRGGTLELAVATEIGSWHDRCVLLVDDVFDSGTTLERLAEYFREEGVEDLRTAVLLRKMVGRRTEFVPDFVAFDIPDVFVVGYGLDYNERYRNLPYLAIADPQT